MEGCKMITTGKGGLGGNCSPTTSEKPVESKEIKITTVLFTEWSKGSSLQRTLSTVLTRLAPILGFKVRVTERGLSSVACFLIKTYGGGNTVGGDSV